MYFYQLLYGCLLRVSLICNKDQFFFSPVLPSPLCQFWQTFIQVFRWTMVVAFICRMTIPHFLSSLSSPALIFRMKSILSRVMVIVFALLETSFIIFFRQRSADQMGACHLFSWAFFWFRTQWSLSFLVPRTLSLDGITFNNYLPPRNSVVTPLSKGLIIESLIFTGRGVRRFSLPLLLNISNIAGCVVIIAVVVDVVSAFWVSAACHYLW